MKLSLEWLRQYVEMPPVAPEEIAYNLTMKTAEVEGVETLERTVAGIVVGEIVAVEPMDTGDPGRLMQYVTVNLGGTTLQTVCGAPNVAVGLKSPFAPPGTTIAGGWRCGVSRFTANKARASFAALASSAGANPMRGSWCFPKCFPQALSWPG